LQGSIPFAVIGSNSITEVRGKQVRVRQYPWGMAEGVLFLQCFSKILLYGKFTLKRNTITKQSENGSLRYQLVARTEMLHEPNQSWLYLFDWLESWQIFGKRDTMEKIIYQCFSRRDYLLRASDNRYCLLAQISIFQITGPLS